MGGDGHREQTLADYLSVLQRHKLLILIAVLVVPAVAYTMSARESKVYRATAQVLLDRQADLGSTVTGITAQDWVDPERFVRNRAALARIPEVTRDAVKRAGTDSLAGWELAGTSSVTPTANTDILNFSVTSSDPQLAARLATSYAEAFVSYELKRQTATLARARKEIQGRLEELRASGAAGTDAYKQLERKALDLRTLEVLQEPASVIRAATSSSQIAPNPRRNAILGITLGLILGVGGAFLLNALDRRVRQADEIEQELQVPLLAKLPTPRRNEPLTILERPSGVMAEAVTRLRTSFEFANTDPKTKLVMVTSAGAREGKSTTATNLAIALARAGRSVVLVDLDLRRPSIARLLHLPEHVGLADVAAGSAQLAEALQPIVVTPLRSRLSNAGHTSGALHVIVAGSERTEPGDLLEATSLVQILETLRARAEIVIVDTPPVLATGDATALASKVDAILLVSRLGTLTRPALRELSRTLNRSPAPVLGWVATGAELDEGYSTYKTAGAYLAPRQSVKSGESPTGALQDVPSPRSASGGAGRWAQPRSRG